MRVFRLIHAALVAGVFVLSAGLWRGDAHAADHVIDGVPLPEDVAPLAEGASGFAGTWIGLWDGRLKTILVVEAIDPQGKAKVVYAVADNPGRFKAAWVRYDGAVKGDVLTMFGRRSNIRFARSGSGRLRAVFGDGHGFAVLSRVDLPDLLRPGRQVPWQVGTSEYLTTDLQEDGAPVRLEAVIAKPSGDGPFPLAVVKHGSTGSGANAAAAKATWRNAWFADMLNERGWIVAFPQRRGRGRSDGVYDEGFAEDRSAGYTCEPDRSLAGADRALADLRAAVLALRRRPDVADGPVLLAGNSRGGALAIAYAGIHPDETYGAINFVGGWMGDGCRTADTINQTLFKRGSAFAAPTLWLYGADDVFYSLAHSRKNFEAFRRNGGQGRFVEVTVRGENNGHWVMALPPLWSRDVNAYLDERRR